MQSLLPRLACGSSPITTTKALPTLSGFAPKIPLPCNFSYTRLAMTAQKIDGTAIARKIRTRIVQEIAEKQKRNPRFQPALTIIQGQIFLRII